MGIFDIHKSGPDKQRMVGGPARKKNKKKKRRQSRQPLIDDGHDNRSSTSSTTSADPEVNGRRHLHCKESPVILRSDAPYSSAVSRSTKNTESPPKMKFRPLQEYEYDIRGDDTTPQHHHHNSNRDYIPPPDRLKQFRSANGSTKKAYNPSAARKTTSDCEQFERFESRSGDDSFASPFGSKHQPKTKTIAKTKHNGSNKKLATPLRNSKIDSQNSRSVLLSSKKKVKPSPSQKKQQQKTTAPAFPLSSDYISTRISPRKVVRTTLRHRQLELVGSTDSSTYCEYEPPPFLAEHKRLLNPKATFHLESHLSPSPLVETPHVAADDRTSTVPGKSREKNKETTAEMDSLVVGSSRQNKPKTKKANGKGYHNETIVTDIDSRTSGSFDVRSWNSSPVREDAFAEVDADAASNASTRLSATSKNDPTDHNSDSAGSFRQIVFNDSMDKIEQVAVAKSDTGASDFSDFVKAAAKLTQNFSKEKSRHQQQYTETGHGMIGKAKYAPPANNNNVKATLLAKSAKKRWPALKEGKDTPPNGLHSASQALRSVSKIIPSKNDVAFTADQFGMAFKGEVTPPSAIKSAMSTLVADKESSQSDPFSPLRSSSKSLEASTPRISTEDFYSPPVAAANAATPKDRDNLHTPRSAGIKSTANLQNSPFVAPSSLPSYRMKTYKGLMTEPVEAETNDGFSVFSVNSSLSSKNRLELREAIRSKAKTPQKSPRYPTEGIKSVDTGSMMGDCSVASESVSKVSSIRDPFQITDNGEIEDNLFKLIDKKGAPPDKPTFSSDLFNFTDEGNTLWDPVHNPFFQSRQVKMNVAEKATDVNKTSSMDDGLIASIRKASSKASDPAAESRKRDPSPTIVRTSISDGNIQYPGTAGARKDYYYPPAGSAVQRRSPFTQSMERNEGSSTKPTMTVPANAILGSMLFRQTLATQIMQQPPEAQKREDKQSKSRGSRSNSTADEHNDRVPQSVNTSDCERSVVSSVTEDASSFYEQSHGGSSSAKWNRQIQTMLNQFNARQVLQSRPGSFNRNNNANVTQPLQSKQRPPQQDQIKPSLTRSEEEHVSMFRADAQKL